MSGIRISPDKKRIAYFARFPPNSGLVNIICIEPAGGTGQGIIKIELVTGMASDLRWSPDGAHLACCLNDPKTTPCTPLGIAWITNCRDPAGPQRAAGQTHGMSFAWMPTNEELAVASSAFLRIINIQKNSEKKIADLHDDGDPLFPPKVAVSPDGNRIAYTTRRTDENISRVWIANLTDERWGSILLTSYPGAFVFLSPFWSPDSMTLGLHVVHPKMEKSEIAIFPNLSGEGEIVYRNNLLNPVHEPSYVPSGNGIIFYHAAQPSYQYTKAGPAHLALLVLCGNSPAGMHILTEPSDNNVWLRFIDTRQLAVDGADAVFLLNLPFRQDHDRMKTGQTGRLNNE